MSGGKKAGREAAEEVAGEVKSETKEEEEWEAISAWFGSMGVEVQQTAAGGRRANAAIKEREAALERAEARMVVRQARVAALQAAADAKMTKKLEQVLEEMGRTGASHGELTAMCDFLVKRKLHRRGLLMAYRAAQSDLRCGPAVDTCANIHVVGDDLAGGAYGYQSVDPIRVDTVGGSDRG